MDEGILAAVRQWLIKADHDLRSARRLFTDDPPLLDTAAYHCQQAVEKSLKAFLALNEVPLSKSHLLLPLLEKCLEHQADFEQLRDAAEVLTPFATAFRYPGDVLEPEIRDVEEAIGLADLVVAFVLRKMPASIRVEFSR